MEAFLTSLHTSCSLSATELCVRLQHGSFSAVSTYHSSSTGALDMQDPPRPLESAHLEALSPGGTTLRRCEP